MPRLLGRCCEAREVEVAMGRLHQRHQRRPGRRPRPGCCCCCCTTATLAACVAASPRCGCGWRYCVRLRSGTTRARWIAPPPRTWYGASPLHKQHAHTQNRARESAQRCARTATATRSHSHSQTQPHSHYAPEASAVRRGPLMSLGFSQPASWHSWSVVGTGDGVGLMTAPSLCCGGDGTVVRPSKPTHTHTQQHQHARQARPA